MFQLLKIVDNSLLTSVLTLTGIMNYSIFSRVVSLDGKEMNICFLIATKCFRWRRKKQKKLDNIVKEEEVEGVERLLFLRVSPDEFF